MSLGIEKGTFLQEAERKLPEKIITNIEVGRRFAEQNKRESSFLLSLARELNPVFCAGEREVPPMLVYGTVDPVGNVSETLTMMKMAEKMGVPTVFILDDVCHDLVSCHTRIMGESFDVLGFKVKRSNENLRFDRTLANEVLPSEVLAMLVESGMDKEVSLAEAYEAGLYLLVEEVVGQGASEKLALLRSSLIFAKNSLLGKVPIGFLREKVGLVAENNKKDDLVFLHLEEEKVRSSNNKFDEMTLADLYDLGGSLGGTALVTVTTMLLDRGMFESNTHPLILAEKDTALGANFAAVYDTLLNRKMESHKIAVSGIRRTKITKNQKGGDGIDPLVMLYLLKKTKYSPVYKKMLTDLVEDCFPLGGNVPRERQLFVADEATVKTNMVAMLKQATGIDGKYLQSLGVEYKKIGSTLLLLSEAMLAGSLSSEGDVLKIIKQL